MIWWDWVSEWDAPAVLNTDVCRVLDYCFVSAVWCGSGGNKVFFFFFLNNCLVADIHKLQILEYILAAFSINGCMYIFKEKISLSMLSVAVLLNLVCSMDFFPMLLDVFQQSISSLMHLL